MNEITAKLALFVGVVCEHVPGVRVHLAGDELIFWHPHIENTLSTGASYIDHASVELIEREGSELGSVFLRQTRAMR